MVNISSIYQNQAFRYCVVGGMNTAVTAAVILILTASEIGLYTSNFLGYLAGIFFSFILNTYFTFSAKPSFIRLVKFISCCVICYLINLVAIKTAMNFVLENKYIVQLIGMFFYTVSGFLINKLWVMK